MKKRTRNQFFRLCLGTALVVFSGSAHANLIWDQFQEQASQIQDQNIRNWPAAQNGRIKPLDTLARESMIFMTGSYKFRGIRPLQLWLGLMASENAGDLDVIEVRSPEVRTQLGLPPDRRIFSMKELQTTKIEELVGPLAEKRKVNKRQLSELENKLLETREQMFLFEQIQTGSLLVEVLDPSLQGANHASEPNKNLIANLKAYMQAVTTHQSFDEARLAHSIHDDLVQQKWPDSLKDQVNHVDLEVLYNTILPFRWACWLFFAMVLFLMAPDRIPRPKRPWHEVILFLPVLVVLIGFGIRVSITGFAPVTNMYGTMVWVSLGIGLFGWVFNLFYQNRTLLALIYFGSFVLLLITDQIPLVISPDMDPIVAVLRSNLWLTIHVLTITISYAAFSLAMILGNATMVREILNKKNEEWIKLYSHYCYRACQLGVFLLSVGIILGGVWADYSWGRFWGWDPKETWALIADLGFLVLLHGRFVGWITPYRLLIFAPLSYLLVIMAWYGVNFILATGLHSYGFSSGGAQMVTGFVIVQLVILAVASFRHWSSLKKV